MIIGIIGAMQVEVKALKAELKNSVSEHISGIEFVRGELCGQQVVVAQCGIGKVFAAVCAETMILRYDVDCVLNTGVGGTLTDRLGILDIAFASAVVQHDMDTSAIGDPVGLISGINKIEIPASPEMNDDLCRAAEALQKRYSVGVIASGDQFIGDENKKKWIRDTFDAIACEMEGAAIGHVCYLNHIPFAVVRSISDNASGEAGMEYPEMVQRAAAQSTALVQLFLKMQK